MDHKFQVGDVIRIKRDVDYIHGGQIGVIVEASPYKLLLHVKLYDGKILVYYDIDLEAIVP